MKKSGIFAIVSAYMPHQQFEKPWRRYKSTPSSHVKKAPGTGYLSLKDFKSKAFWQHWMRKLFIAGIFVVLFGSLFTVAAFGYFARQLPDIHSLLNRYVAQSTKIYDRTGEVLLYEIHGDEKRTVVELNQVNDRVKQALISAEDKNFYTHKGFSLLGIIRSAIKNILTGSSQGGSTLTQQMIKNTLLTNEKTYTRKIKELILSREAEQTFNKDEILKIYLNTINYGGVNYGVEAGAQAFFGKHALDVTLAEAAILAALPQAPSRLSPYGKRIDELTARQHWVLDRMAEDGFITKDEAKSAKEEKIEFKKQELGSIKAPHFVFYVKDKLIEQFGEESVNQGGMKIITTLDWEKQQAADEAVHSANEFNLAKGANDAALVSLDAKTGEILAMVGSQDFFNDEIAGKVNVSIEKRQPGSSIKPIVYATALQKGFTSETVVYDVNTNFAVSGKDYIPRNFDLKERGPVTMRKALQGSLNIPAVKFMYLAGVDSVMAKLADDLEYSTITKKQDCGLSLVLGGCEVTLLDHASAFTAFARDGIMAKPAGILEVYDKTGNQLFKFAPKNKKVWDEQTARQLNNILSDNEARAYVFGAKNQLTLGDRPVAAKTGTTNDYNDGWTIGYTPSIVTGVWVGNADGTDMKSGADGSIVAAPIWNAYMRKALGSSPIEYFKTPEPLPNNLKPVLMGAVSGGPELVIDRISGKLATAFTPEHLKVKKIFRQDHNILFYVDKDDPRGPVPANPEANDPAFTNWENAVQDWVKRQALAADPNNLNPEVSSEEPPTEYDDVHLPEFIPSLQITNPSSGQGIESTTFDVSADAFAPKGISKVEFYVDNVLLGAAFSTPYLTSLNVSAFSQGFHTLKVIAYDPVENIKEQSIELNFKFQSNLPNISWQAPAQNVVVTKDSYPLEVSFKLSKPTTGVEILFSPAGTYSSPSLILSPLGNNGQFTIYWKTPPPPGKYHIFVRVSDGMGGKVILPNSVPIEMK